MLKEKLFFSMVVYVHNAEQNIAAFLQESLAYLNARFERFEVILVNDASQDQTLKVIEQAAQEESHLSIINLAWRHGHELAMLAGSDLAIGDMVLELETTIRDYEFSLIDQMLEQALKGTDIVTANPSKKINFFSALFYAVFNRISFVPITLKTERLRLISRRALNRVLASKEKVRFRKIIFQLSGFSFKELAYEPSHTIKRIAAEKRFGQRLETAIEILLIYSNIGSRLCFYIAMFFLLLSMAIGTYAILIFINLATVVEGWTTLMLVLSTGFSGLFIVLGILAKYVALIMTEVRKKPLYVVKSVLRFANTTQKIC